MPSVHVVGRKSSASSRLEIALGASASLAALALILLCGFAAPAPPARLAEIGRTPFVAEGVAVTPKGAILVSGVEGRTVLLVGPRGAAPWLKRPAAGGLFGMSIDARHDRLWIAETGGADVPGGAGPHRTGVLEVRLSDGGAIAFRPAPEDGKPHWIGDLTVEGDGTVYASDSMNGQVYRLAPGGKALTVLAETGLRSLQGLVVTADGKNLIVGDYSTGLHRLSLADGAVGPVMAFTGAELRGLDGLKRHGRDLIATQNGTKTQRVLRLTLTTGETGIAAVETLASGPELEDVSLGAVDGDRYLFVARSGWAGYDDKGQPNGKPHQRPVIATLSLPPG